MAYLSVPKIFRHLTFLHLSSPFIVDNCSHISNLSFAITYKYFLLSDFFLFFFLLSFDIGKHLISAPVTDRYGTVRRIPQMSAPQFLFSLRMYKKHLACKISLHDLDHI